MVEKKVYKNWALSENAEEERDMNLQIYNELIQKYKCLYKDKPTQEDLDNYDLVFATYSYGYANIEYVVHKKPESLSDDEIMLILDNGNLCFGGRNNGLRYYKIYTD